MKLLRFAKAKAWRWVLAGLLAFQAADAAWDVLWWHMPLLALIPLLLAGGVVWAVRLNARTIRNLESQNRLPPPRAPVIMARREPPFCRYCAIDDAVTDAEYERVLMLGSFGSFINPYAAHRDCWITTGDKDELKRMLRHVTWQPS